MNSNYTTGTSDDISSSIGQGQDFYSDTTSTRGSTGAAMRDELSNLKSDLDALMAKASSLSDRELRDARDKMMGKFSSMRHAAKGVASQANRQLQQSVDVTTDYVKEKPLQSVAIATGVGLLLGAVLRRH